MDTSSQTPAAGPDAAHLLTLCAALGVAPASTLSQLLLQQRTPASGLGQMVAELLRGELTIAGVGPGARRRLIAALELADLLALESLPDKDPVTSPGACHHWLKLHLGQVQQERFCCLFLNAAHRVLRAETLFRGTLDAAAVYPRVVVERALLLGASAVIAAHNHPSGQLTPSPADLRITERLRAALGVVDIRLLDHVIIGGGECLSLAELGHC